MASARQGPKELAGGTGDRKRRQTFFVGIFARDYGVPKPHGSLDLSDPW